MIGLINTSYTIGTIVAGFFFGGPLADVLGRRWGMWTGCLLTVITTFMQAFAPRHNLECFIAGRVLVGLGQGIALTSGPVYIGEMAPPPIRGLIMAFWQLVYSVGSFIAHWINYACSLHRSALGERHWKMVVIFQIMVPIIITILLPFQPESPRGHIKKNGNIKAAKSALRKIRDTEQEVEDEALAIRKALEYEKEAISNNYTAMFKDPFIRKRLYLAFVINVGQQLSGQGTLNTYSTAIYKKVWTSTQTINLINADRFDRRWLFIIGGIGVGVRMLLVPPVGISIVFLLFFCIFFYKPSWGATTWIWTSEIFSVNVRAQAIGMCSQMQNVANTIFQKFFPTFLKNKGLKCIYVFIATNFLLVVFVYFFIPETKQIPLKEIDVLFGGANHVDKGAQILGGPDIHTKEVHVIDQ
ncbi:sugar transporter [Trichoderma compactum]